jgi:hypothetical protein
MTQIQTHVRMPRRIAKLVKPHHQVPARTHPNASTRRTEGMLREMAFVLHVTELVKKSIMEGGLSS